MRQNPSFAMTDLVEIRRVISQNPWATPVATGGDGSDRLARHGAAGPRPRRPDDRRPESGTVGFRRTPSRVSARRKLGQNKPDDVVESVTAELDGGGEYANPGPAAETRRAHETRPAHRR
ncbi:hypothetical protein [Microbacterium soli]|uniref:Uncharacterized protein n=1 Tax=Microbacterium soli TaxID=446075 RepID=A0ABP7NJA3_9MICO